MEKNIKWQVLSCVVALNLVGSAMAGTIGINIMTERTAGVQASAIGGGATGLLPQAGWNDELAEFAGDGNVHLLLDGILTGTEGETATITNNNPTGNWRTQNLGGSGGDATNYLFDGYLEGFDDGGANQPVSLTVDGLDEAVFTSGYSVILYFATDGGAQGSTGNITINGGSDVPIVLDKNVTEFDDDAGDGDGINAYTFDAVTGTSFTVTAWGDDAANRFGIAGLQIIPDGTTEPVLGDANRDGFVLFNDFELISDNFYSTPTAAGLDGDVNFDGFIDEADFREWRIASGADSLVAAGTAVPEPTTVVLLGLSSLLGLTLIRRDR